MPIPQSAQEVLGREFLEIRAKLLEVAAWLDRLHRAEGSVENDPRMKRIGEAFEVLQKERGDCAERFQQVFSRPYDESWRRRLGIGSST